jgi:hypothetical protein
MAETLPEVQVEMARVLSDLTDTEVIPIFGGFRLRETETCYIDVMRMLVNWRVTETYKDFPGEYGRHWCFAGGSGVVALVRVAYAVAKWDGADDTEPAGWIKNGQTGELRREAHG